ncbi:MAG: hypothetical protein IT303_14630 [Dehalococcoidia bacterium]|nr:hypothetical protein [Dehalococcoidia bacterium]
MAVPVDIRLAQLARMLALPATPTPEAARAAIAARPGDVAYALFAEAADSDDVLGIDSARVYLDQRMSDLADFVGESEPHVRTAFEGMLDAWR